MPPKDVPGLGDVEGPFVTGGRLRVRRPDLPVRLPRPPLRGSHGLVVPLVQGVPPGGRDWGGGEAEDPSRVGQPNPGLYLGTPTPTLTPWSPSSLSSSVLFRRRGPSPLPSTTGLVPPPVERLDKDPSRWVSLSLQRSFSRHLLFSRRPLLLRRPRTSGPRPDTKREGTPRGTERGQSDHREVRTTCRQ